MPVKKLLIALMALCLVCLAACGGLAGQPSGSTPPLAVTERPAAGTSQTASQEQEPSTGSDPQIDHEELVGLWHASPVVGAGFSIRLFLVDEHNFIWIASQMDGMERVRARSGYWSVADDRLELNTTEEICWEGGFPVPAFASWGSDQVIVEADVVEYRLTQPIKESYSLSAVTTDTVVLDKRTVTIGDAQFWELAASEDVNAFFDEHEDLRAQAAQDAKTPGPPSAGDVLNQTLSESDQYVLELAREALELLKNKDWGALGHLVHPEQGLTFSPYGYVDVSTAVCLGMGDVIPLWMDDTVRTWGVDAWGEPLELTIDQYYDRFIFDRDYTRAPQIAVNNIILSNYENNLFVFGNGCHFVEFHVPGGEDKLDYNWSSLRLVFGYFEGGDSHESGMYLVGIVHENVGA